MLLQVKVNAGSGNEVNRAPARKRTASAAKPALPQVKARHSEQSRNQLPTGAVACFGPPS
jgi:hypothetical protein